MNNLKLETTLTKLLPYTNKYGDTYIIDSSGTVYNVTRDRVIKQKIDSDGYKLVHLGTDNQNIKVHRLVAEAFIPNPDNKPTVDHIDRNKCNNNVDNLRWATHKEQAQNMDRGIKIKVTELESGTTHMFNSLSEANIYYCKNNSYFTYLLSIGGTNKKYKVEEFK